MTNLDQPARDFKTRVPLPVAALELGVKASAILNARWRLSLGKPCSWLGRLPWIRAGSGKRDRLYIMRADLDHALHGDKADLVQVPKAEILAIADHVAGAFPEDAARLRALADPIKEQATPSRRPARPRLVRTSAIQPRDGAPGVPE